MKKSRPFAKQENIDKLWILYRAGTSKQELSQIFGVKKETISRTLYRHAEHQQQLDIIRDREKMNNREYATTRFNELQSLNQNILDLLRKIDGYFAKLSKPMSVNKTCC